MTDLLAELAQREAELQGLPVATSDSVIDEAELYDPPAPAVGISAPLAKAEEIQAQPAEAVSASPPVPMYDFSDEPAAISELNRRVAGLPLSEALPIIANWEALQLAYVRQSTPGWNTFSAYHAHRNGFHGPLRYREIGVA